MSEELTYDTAINLTKKRMGVLSDELKKYREKLDEMKKLDEMEKTKQSKDYFNFFKNKSTEPIKKPKEPIEKPTGTLLSMVSKTNKFNEYTGEKIVTHYDGNLEVIREFTGNSDLNSRNKTNLGILKYFANIMHSNGELHFNGVTLEELYEKEKFKYPDLYPDEKISKKDIKQKEEEDKKDQEIMNSIKHIKEEITIHENFYNNEPLKVKISKFPNNAGIQVQFSFNNQDLGNTLNTFHIKNTFNPKLGGKRRTRKRKLGKKTCTMRRRCKK